MSKLKSDSNSIIAIGMIMICMLVIAFLITGCDAIDLTDEALDIYATTEKETQVYTTYNNPVTMPIDIKYLVPNAISEVIQESNDGTTYNNVSYPAYSGLKSQEVQDKVNAQVESLILEIKGLLDPQTIAPFRGIKSIVKETTTLSDSYISFYTSFSANNILSIRCYGSGTYKASVDAFNETSWISVNRGLNLDLNTGEKVPLDALFIDGYDYESVINDAIVEHIDQNNLMDETYLEYTYFPARLTKPFDGIDDDQAYCLDNFNLTIIIDENDPRFDTVFEQITFSVPLAKFGDNLAINARYYEVGNNLYIDETERRILPVWKSDGQGQSTNFEGTFEGGKWYLIAYDQNDHLDDVFDRILTESKAYLNGLVIEGKDNFAEMMLSKVSIGRFTSFSQSLWVTKGDDYISSMDYQLYDATGKMLDLEDLFIEGFDYESSIKNYVKAQLLINGQYTDADIESAYASNCFTLEQSNLMIQLPLLDLVTGSNFQQVYIPFESFGVRNMTIFN